MPPGRVLDAFPNVTVEVGAVLYDGRRPGTSVLVGINRGVLPNTEPTISPR